MKYPVRGDFSHLLSYHHKCGAIRHDPANGSAFVSRFWELEPTPTLISSCINVVDSTHAYIIIRKNCTNKNEGSHTRTPQRHCIQRLIVPQQSHFRGSAAAVPFPWQYHSSMPVSFSPQCHNSTIPVVVMPQQCHSHRSATSVPFPTHRHSSSTIHSRRT